jgi:extracellular elastinolytic metalloproteinase
MLCWHFKIHKDGLQSVVVVSAENGVIHYSSRRTKTIGAKGNVHLTNGSEARQWVSFPLQPDAYPLPVNGSALPFNSWVLSDATQGENVIARLADSVSGITGVFKDMELTFDPLTPQDQQVLNIFYFCNFMHDFFYLLGFDKAAGSFDGNDPIVACAHPHAISYTATMDTRPDGSSPLMNMGLYNATGYHTALDADVVFHEYVHGVTNRLVGGRTNMSALDGEQSSAMGEGWSDYFALSIQNFNLQVEKTVIGNWVTGTKGGIRSIPYDDHFSKTYGALRWLSGEHDRGEIWCATLMYWTRRLCEELPKPDAYYICWQAIVDGLKLTNANPSFLDARNGIVRALEALFQAGRIPAASYQAALRTCWVSFAKFGMGINARSSGPKVHGITEGFAMPVIH